MLGGFSRKEVRDEHTTKCHKYKQALSSHKDYWHFPETVIKVLCVECRMYFCRMHGRGKKEEGLYNIRVKAGN